MNPKNLADLAALGLVYAEGFPTLAQYVGDFLAEAEALFGPRDRDFTFVGVEMVGDHPDDVVPEPAGTAPSFDRAVGMRRAGSAARGMAARP